MKRLKNFLVRFAPAYCGSCGWWVDACPHQ